MRICTLVDRFPPLVGGAEIQAKQLSVELARQGISVMVLTRHILPELPTREETPTGLKIYRVPPSGERSHARNAIGVFTFTYALLKHRHEYDLIHVHDMFSLLIAAILVRLVTRKPLVVKVPARGNIVRQPSKTTPISLYSRILHNLILPRPVWLWLLRRVDVFIAISDEIAAELREAGFADKITRITNAVNTTRFRPTSQSEQYALRRRLGLPIDAAVIVSHGRIVEGKRIDVLIRAISELHKHIFNMVVILPGPFYPQGTPLEHELKALVKSLGLESIISFPGPTTTPEDYLRAADVFVLTSESEGLPNSLLEAMATGIPVCASNIGGISNLIRSGHNGILFSVEDSIALAACLHELLTNTDRVKTITENALGFIREKFTWDTIVADYEILYSDLITKSQKHRRVIK